MIYSTDKSDLIDGRIPKDLRNREYQQVMAEVKAGTSTIEPYTQDIQDLRQEKIQAIKREGVKRISAKVDALDNIGMILLVYKHMWPVTNASQDLLDGKAIADHAISRISMARSATREQLEAYDAATDNGWPA